MKKVYILITAICLAAFTGCIKEDVELTTANIDMTISTRAILNSSEQGDKIGDINVWAFACDANGNVSDSGQTAVAWRYIPNAGTHTSVDVHLQFATCDDDADHHYKLVTVINSGDFGTVNNDESFTFDRNTTYSQLANAKFQNKALMSEKPGNGPDADPTNMPISHWTIITLNNSNNGSTHPDYCYSVNMPVYRAVAKTQLFVAKTDASTNLVIKNVTIGSSAYPTEGVLLSAAAGSVNTINNSDGTTTTKAGDLNPNNTPSWYVTSVSTETSKVSDILSAESVTVNPDNTAQKIFTAHPTIEDSEVSNYYDYVTSYFLYENAGGSTAWDTESTNGGYYMDVTYNVGGADKTERVWLPAVVRNHDYQVRALVDAGGKLTLELVVNEWNEVTEEINYNDIVGIQSQLTWTLLPSNATTTDGVVNMGNGIAQAECTFHISTPKGGKWHAELVTVAGSDTAFTFVDGDGNPIGKTTSGPIGTEGLLRIKTTKNNSTLNGGTEVNRVELRITASATVGGVIRTYKVTGLTGLTGDANFVIEQGI